MDKWRIRKAARLAFHAEYGAYYPAMAKSDKQLHEMNLSEEETKIVKSVVDWMVDQVKTKDRWF